MLATTPIDEKLVAKEKWNETAISSPKRKKNYTKTGDNKLDNTFGFQTYYVYYYYYYYYYYYVFYYEQGKKKKLTTNSMYYDGSGKYSLSWPYHFQLDGTQNTSCEHRQRGDRYINISSTKLFKPVISIQSLYPCPRNENFCLHFYSTFSFSSSFQT